AALPVASATLPTAAATLPVGLPTRCGVGQFRPPVARHFPDAWFLRSTLRSAAWPVAPPPPASPAIPGSVPPAWTVRRRISRVVLAVVFARLPALAAVVPVGRPARCAVGQSRPRVARRLPDAWSLQPTLLSGAWPAAPLRPAPPAIPGFALQAWFVRRGNTPAVPVVVFAPSLAPAVTVPVELPDCSAVGQCRLRVARRLLDAWSLRPTLR